jgi:DNA-binding MarR family transcriptional regulator
MKFPQLFAALRKKREFERLQMPFITSMLDFDVIIEIGYAQEQNRAITPKQLFLLKLGSVTTVRRRLARLTAQGIVARHGNTRDHRSEFLTLPASTLRILEKYGNLYPTRHDALHLFPDLRRRRPTRWGVRQRTYGLIRHGYPE